MKYLLHLAYRGTNYHGWQRQPGHPSVQQALEEALEKMLRQKTVCVGCGRTDTGVHASHFFAHFRTTEESGFAEGYDPVQRLNRILPTDISVHGIHPVPANFHAQHDATARRYTYRIHTQKDAFLDGLSAFYPAENLDLEKMQAATTLLPTVEDFRAMCKQPDLYKHTRCRLTEAAFTIPENGRQLRLDFTADRFLRNMVRLLVGNILEVGYGRLTLAKFEEHLRSGERPKIFKLARPEGLYLSGVHYARLSDSFFS